MTHRRLLLGRNWLKFSFYAEIGASMSLRLAVLPALAALALMGCSRDEIQSYRVPKEDPTTALPTTATANAAPSAPSALTWQAPAHWQEQTAGGFRRGSFSIPGEGETKADLSIIAFPGDAGGLAANLNRWRGQIGLAALSTGEVQAGVEHVDTPTFHVDLVDYLGEADGTPTRILGAILEHGGESWFFKLMGPDAIVAGETEAFRNFIQTVAPAAP